MTKLELFKKAAKSGGIGRHVITRQALQLSERTLQLFEISPSVMHEFDIELPHQDNSLFTIDKMDVEGWKSLFANPCQGQVR